MCRVKEALLKLLRYVPIGRLFAAYNLAVPTWRAALFHPNSENETQLIPSGETTIGSI